MEKESWMCKDCLKLLNVNNLSYCYACNEITCRWCAQTIWNAGVGLMYCHEHFDSAQMLGKIIGLDEMEFRLNEENV